MSLPERQQLAFREKGFYSFEEIDAKNLYFYKFGSQNVSPLASGPGELTVFDSLGMIRFHSMDINVGNPLSVYTRALKLTVSFSSTSSVKASWLVQFNHSDSFSKPISVRKGSNSFSALLPFSSSYSFVEQFLSNFSGFSNFSFSVSLFSSADKTFVSAKSLNRSAFYVQELLMKPGESVAFDSPHNVFTNNTGSLRVYRFDKPVSTSGFYVLFGSPEIVFFCLEEESRF